MTSDTPIKYLLSREAIESAVEGPPVIHASEQWGHFIGVVVGADLQRTYTVATHMVMSGHGDRLAFGARRRVETVGTPLFSDSKDLAAMAQQLMGYAKTLPNVTITVDETGLGLTFLSILQQLAKELPQPARRLRCTGALYGGKVKDPAYARRFVTPRAQAYVHTAEAFKDGAVRLDNMPCTMIKQGSEIPYDFDDHGRFRVDRSGARPPADATGVWDTVAMAFLAGVDFLPAASEPQVPVPGAIALDLDRIAQDALRGIGASSGDTLRLVAEVREYRELQAQFADIERTHHGNSWTSARGATQ